MKRLATTLVLLGAMALVFAFLPTAASALDGVLSKERTVPLAVDPATLLTDDAAPPDGGRSGDPDNTGGGLSVSDSGDDTDDLSDTQGSDELTWEEYLLFLVMEFLAAP